MRRISNPVITVIKYVFSFVLMFILFWFMLPPLNLRSGEFWSYVINCIIIFVVVHAFSYIVIFIRSLQSVGGYDRREKFSIKKLGIPAIVAVGLAVVLIVFSMVMNLVGAEIFNAGRYNQLLTLSDGDFSEDVAELKMSQIPVVDRDTSVALGKRKLGEMSDLVSQFEIAENYTQINYNEVPTRTTLLEYGDVIKWFNNHAEGIPGYLRVDMTTQEVELVRLSEGIKYSESDYFMRNINRYLRFNYPTKIFDNLSFEIDDAGNPYWVASVVEYKIGFWSGKDIGGAVLVNAVTGEHQYYDLDKIPQWVDQVYDADMIINQLNYNGKYRSGYFNSIFGQKGVLAPTEGYNYLAIDDDVWLYTGMTSVVSDESNVGFVLVNLRTKEAKYYEVPGAEEYSAMESAEGQVQEKNYTATFPILLNVSDRPTYFMSLKDDAGLVKMYAFVDVQQYQIVGTGSSVDEAKADYIKKLGSENIEVTNDNPDVVTKTVEVTVSDVATAVVGGNTKYYIKTDNGTFIVDITLSSDLPFVSSGDKAVVTIKTSTEETSADISEEIVGFKLK